MLASIHEGTLYKRSSLRKHIFDHGEDDTPMEVEEDHPCICFKINIHVRYRSTSTVATAK